MLHELMEAEHKLAQITRLMLHSSVYLAFEGVGLAVFSALALGLPHQLGAYTISFLMIYAMYNMNKYSDLKEDILTYPRRHSFYVKNRRWIESSAVLSVIFSLIIGYIGGMDTVFMVLLPMVLAILYSFKWMPKKILGYARLKDVTLVKNILLGICWVAITTWVVVTYAHSSFSLAAICISIIVFSRVVINTVVFDIRDMHGDKKHGTHTLPVLLGQKKTVLFLYAYLSLVVLFTFAVTLKGILPPMTHLVNVTSVLAYYYIRASGRDGHIHAYLDIVADGEFKAMGIAALVGSALI